MTIIAIADVDLTKKCHIEGQAGFIKISIRKSKTNINAQNKMGLIILPL
jgi:hypothetical protein